MALIGPVLPWPRAPLAPCPLAPCRSVEGLFDVNGVEFTSHQTFMEKPFDSAIDRKVVLRIHARHLRLTRSELRLLAQIAGPRYSITSQYLRMATQRHSTVTENKRELLELLHELVKETKAVHAAALAKVPKKPTKAVKAKAAVPASA
jgi:hypothetical protein